MATASVPRLSTEHLDSAMPLRDYVKEIYAPAKIKDGFSGHHLHDAIISVRWFDAFLKRPPTLDDLSKLVASERDPSKLIQFIMEHGRTGNTAKAQVERLFAVWRFALEHGHVAPVGKRVKLPAPNKRAMRKLRQGTKPASVRIPTSEQRARENLAESLVAPPLRRKKLTRETTLEELLMKHYSIERPLAPGTIRFGYMNAIRSFGRFLGRMPRVKDLNPQTVNPWIAKLLLSLSPYSVHGMRRTILCFWRFAFEEGLADFPKKVRKVQRPRLVVEAWDSAQTAKLLEAADAKQGAFRKTGIERQLWWRAFILMAWYSGLRLGDVLAIKNSQIARMPDGTGRLSLVMQKTQERIDRLFPADAMAAIDAVLGSGERRDLILPTWVNRRFWYREFKALAKSAGLEGSSKWLRRGSASEAEKIQPGAGRLHLGHRTTTVFQNNYRCDRIVQSQIILPPAPSSKGGAA